MSVRRLAPGEYEVTDGRFAVVISRFYWLPSSGPQWVARAEWDQHLYTDPLWTLTEAKAQAVAMIKAAGG